jgi:hypothetical protein
MAWCGRGGMRSNLAQLTVRASPVTVTNRSHLLAPESDGMGSIREMLMSFFEQVLPWAMRHGNALQFGLIWITITAAAVICVTWPFAQAIAPTSQKATRRPINLILTWRQAGARSAFVALTLLAVFLASYVAMTLAWEDFAYYDNSIFTLRTLKGHGMGLWIIPESGRFMPLAFQEFNLIRHFTDTITGYHVPPIAQLLIVSWILLILDDELSITVRAALVILALLTPSILLSFTSLIFSESGVLFFLACLVLSVKRFEQTQSIAWAVAAVFCAQLMIYCKETAFLLLLGFAASRLILRRRNAHLAGWDSGRLWVRESRLDVCLASLAVLFLIFYFGVIGIHRNMNYAASARLPRADVVLGYTRVALLPWLLVAVLLGRIYLILRHRVAPLLLWDGLAFGGVACFLAYAYLSMFSVYYLAPVDLIAVLYVGRFAVLSWKEMRPWGKIAGMLLAFLVLFQDVLVSAFVVFERKNVIHAKAGIASVVETQYRQGTGNDLRLFFPFAGGYQLMEFGAYLNYRGVPVEGAAGEASGLNRVFLAEASRTRAKNLPPGTDGPRDGACVEWTSIRCQVVSGPAPGDLVIVFPDDEEASLAEAFVYRKRGELLFFYNPYPSLPQWLHWLFDSLHIGAESRYRYGTLADRWMDGSVTKWR